MDTRASKRSRISGAGAGAGAGAEAQPTENLVSVVSSMLKRITELEGNRGAAFNEKYDALMAEYNALQAKYRELEESIAVERQRGVYAYSVLLKEKETVHAKLKEVEHAVRKADAECCSLFVMILFYITLFGAVFYGMNAVGGKN